MATPYDVNFPSCERTVAELRLYSESTPPESLSMALGLKPTSSRTKGALQETAPGKFRPSAVNGWILSSEHAVQSRDLRHHLDWLLDKLDGKSALLSQSIIRGGWSGWIQCIWWASEAGGGPIISASELAGLGALGLEVQFEFADYNG